ncbi:MAG: serine--tRNA ligase [Pirellulales bacterium]|nr:serine--tRNA ligase [Pirellulales bacterium]
MLDRKFILENIELVKQNCANRGAAVDVDRFVELEQTRKAKLIEVEELNRRTNEVSKLIGKAKDQAEREERKEQGRLLRQQTQAAQAELDALAAEADDLLRLIPNLSHPEAPIGVDDKSNLELFRSPTSLPEFDFQPLDHVELAERLDLVDFEAGASVAGHGFYFLKNDAVLLELALQRYAVETLLGEGFTPLTTPDLARNDVLSGIGFIPRGPETQIYSVENSDLSLIATAEITLGGMFAGQTLEAESLPKLFCGVSHCFRTEAGAHGRAARGLFRVHQFTKIEMFAFALPEQSDAMLDRLRGIECRLFDGLEIPYRVVDTATGDLGGPAFRKFDLEAWMPGRGEFGEVTSASNCTDYQARRLNIRYRIKGEKGTKFLHTLNGTAIAVSRALIALLENHQQADGTIVIPEVLRPWLGKDRIAVKG